MCTHGHPHISSHASPPNTFTLQFTSRMLACCLDPDLVAVPEKSTLFSYFGLWKVQELVGDGVGELTAFLRGRDDRSVQQGVVIIVVGSSDVPLSAHAPTRWCLPGFGNIRCRDKNVLNRRLLNNRGERLLALHVIGHRARRRTRFSGVFEDCGLRILSLYCRRNQYHRRVGLCLLVRLLVLPLRRGPTTEVISQTGDDVTSLRAPVRCQLEAAAQDAADEPSFGSGSLCASLLRGASVRNHGISCCYATME